MDKTFTHPTPLKFAQAMSAIAAADHGIPSEVEGDDNEARVIFKDRTITITPGPVQDAYNV